MLLSALLIHYFFPHESNNHRARLLHPIFITLSLFLFLLNQALIPFLPRITPAVLGYASNIPPERVIELTNQKREEKGVEPLRIDPLLTQSALMKASDMFLKDYWAHVSPEGIEPWHFFVQAGYKYRFAGENLARDFSKPEDVVAAWVASPSHRENLLAARYRDIGIAVVDGKLGGVETTLVVQFFGTKFSEAVAESEISTPLTTLTTIPVTPLGASVQKDEGLAKKILVSPFSTTKRTAIFFISLFFTLISIDMVIIGQKNISRRSSKSVAHFLFFGVILVVLLIVKEGAIL